MIEALLLLAGAYLVGSIATGVLIVRLLQGLDVRAVGSGNIGATNVLRAAGKRAALLVLLGDFAKGALPVLAALWLGASPAVATAVAIAAVLGHLFPLFFGWRGGKGVATAAGALAVLLPLATFVACLCFAAAVIASRRVSLGSIGGALVLPIAGWFLPAAGFAERAELAYSLGAAGVALLVVLRHRDNLRRLVAGTEPRLGEEGT